ncbi:MAG: peptidylprolyl isomerase [bacterium]|nr:peptidylprolyl isomerase [bacterium]
MKPMNFVILFLLAGAAGLSGQTGGLYVRENSESLRNGPNGDRIGEITSGTRVEALEKRPDWVKVQITGWIPEKSLTADPTQVAGFTIHLSHIVVATEEEAGRVIRDLKAGTPFGEIAASRSIDAASAARGGDMGDFKRGDLMPAIEEVAFGLNVGQVGGPIRTAFGFHVIQRTR